MSKYQERIVSNHKILLGNPSIKGTRIMVEFVLKKLSEGATMQQFAEDHKLDLNDVYAALEYASARLADREEMLLAK